jgi:hypothetical protein
MASRVQFMRVCWQRGETTSWDVAGASRKAGRRAATGPGRETGGRGETWACGELRAISSSRAAAREARCAARADAREREALDGPRSQAFVPKRIAHLRRDACALRKLR